MSLVEGAKTIVEQCMDISPGETVLVLNDGNDQDLFDALFVVLENNGIDYDYVEYPEPESHGEEPPENVAKKMNSSDVVIAPTNKSLSHTNARRDACDAGTRVATLPTIDKEVWNQSLQVDFDRVEEITEQVYSALEDTETIRIETPSGTDLELSINFELTGKDTGKITEPGDFGNLPAGESDSGAVNASGVLVIDHFPFAPSGTRVEIRKNEAVAIEHPEGGDSELADAFENVEGARNLAEFGFGTNPGAKLIGNVLQDEKVLGTVHLAFGDNSSYFSDTDDRKVECDIHWDTVCESPTVYFDDRKMLDEGEPVFLDS